jgi:hypothetical protein
LAESSLASLFGKYLDDPTWERFMEDIGVYRREVDAEAEAGK